MTCDHQYNPDPNESTARIVREATLGHTTPAAGLEAAWKVWSGQIQAVDERGMTLLKAAFETGFDAGYYVGQHD